MSRPRSRLPTRPPPLSPRLQPVVFPLIPTQPSPSALPSSARIHHPVPAAPLHLPFAASSPKQLPSRAEGFWPGTPSRSVQCLKAVDFRPSLAVITPQSQATAPLSPRYLPAFDLSYSLSSPPSPVPVPSPLQRASTIQSHSTCLLQPLHPSSCHPAQRGSGPEPPPAQCGICSLYYGTSAVPKNF
jgi:hypothetical protein